MASSKYGDLVDTLDPSTYAQKGKDAAMAVKKGASDFMSKAKSGASKLMGEAEKEFSPKGALAGAKKLMAGKSKPASKSKAKAKPKAKVSKKKK
jgi:hypothetical protein